MSTAPTILTSNKAAGLKDLEKRALNNYCQKLFKESENVRKPFYSVWYENLAFFQDQQYASYNENVGLVNSQPALGDSTYRAVVNLIIGAHQNLVAKTIKAKPRSLVVPLSSDALALDVVRFMRQLDDYLEIKLRRLTVRREALDWAYIAGCGITKSFYNDYAGDNLATTQVMMSDDVDLQSLEHPELQEAKLPIYKRVNQGEIDYSVKSPFEIGFDGRNAVRRLSKFYYDQGSYGVDEFRERWPETWRNIRARSGMDQDAFEDYRNKMRSSMGWSPLTSSLDTYALPANARAFGEEIKVVEFYFAPNDMWPEGVFLQWTPNAGDDGILGVTTSPWFFDLPNGRRHIYMWHPYTFWDDIVVPGKPFSRATLESNKHVQRMLNRNVSSIQEFINVVAKYRVLLQKGIQVDRESFTDRMFDFVEIAGDLKDSVMPMPMPSLPSQVTEQRNYLQNTFDIIAHQTLEEEGKAVRSNLSGDAIEYLDALQSVFMTPKVDRYVDGINEDSRKHCLLAKQFYPKNLAEDRNVVIAGRNGRHRVRMFDESLIALDSRFHCVGTSDLTRNVAAKKAEAIKLFSMQAFGPPGSQEATDKLIQTQEFGNLEMIYEQNSIQDTLCAERQDAILDSQAPPNDGPWAFEDHEKALKIINEFRQKYYGMLDEVQRAAIDFYAVEHQRHLAEKMYNQSAEQAQLQTNAAPPQMGGPPSDMDKTPSAVSSKEATDSKKVLNNG